MKPGLKVNGQYCWDISLSRQMLDAVKCVVDYFVFQQDGTSCVQHSATAAVQSSQFPFS